MYSLSQEATDAHPGDYNSNLDHYPGDQKTMVNKSQSLVPPFKRPLSAPNGPNFALIYERLPIGQL